MSPDDPEEEWAEEFEPLDPALEHAWDQMRLDARDILIEIIKGVEKDVSRRGMAVGPIHLYDRPLKKGYVAEVLSERGRPLAKLYIVLREEGGRISVGAWNIRLPGQDKVIAFVRRDFDYYEETRQYLNRYGIRYLARKLVEKLRGRIREGPKEWAP